LLPERELANAELPIEELPKRELSICDTARLEEIAELDGLAAEFIKLREPATPEEGDAGRELLA